MWIVIIVVAIVAIIVIRQQFQYWKINRRQYRIVERWQRRNW